MRPLTEDETKQVFEKLIKFIGNNTSMLIEGDHCFRLNEQKVYYASKEIADRASNFSRDDLQCVGTCIGKFTKTKKFRLLITALNYLAPYAKCKIWLKPSAEQQFLYGNHVLKNGLAKISENTEQYSGVVVYSLNDVPLGFGVASRSTVDCKRADPMAIICFNQADIGEYLRNESTF